MRIHPISTTILVMLMALFSNAWRCSAYEIPSAPPAKSDDPDILELQKISNGIDKIAAGASRAIVLVSTTKQIASGPPELMDPFRFFFGPDFPFSSPQGPSDQQPDNGQGMKQTVVGIGSGFFFDLDKRYILTNNHVIEGADKIHIKVAPGQTYTGKVLGSDANTDIAVIQIDDKNFSKDSLAALVLGNSDDIKSGDLVIALGAPFGLEASVTFGVISATKRGPLEIAKIGNFIQTDAAINPGNSGGPLINIYGQVIGLNTAIFSQSGTYAGVGLAVPSNLARQIAQELLNKGKVERGYLGVQITEADTDVIKDLGVPEGITGALVSNVMKDSPAAKAGVEAGDVIIAIDGKPVKSSGDIVNEIGLMKPGTTTKMTLYRGKKKQEITVKIANYNENVAQKEKAGGAELSFGMVLEPVSSSLAHRYNFESKVGAVVAKVDRRGAAAQAGIRPGDVILNCNDKIIDNPDDFKNCIKDKKRILLRLERSHQFFFVIIEKL